MIAWLSVLIITWPLASLAAGQVAATEDSQWRARFFEEAPKAWQRVGERAEKLQVIREHFVYKDGKLVSWSKSIYRRAGNEALACMERFVEEGKPSGWAMLGVVNRDYSFQLMRSKPESPWKLSSLGNPNETRNLGPVDPAKGSFLRNATVPAWAGIPHELTHPNYTLERFSSVESAGATTVRVDFVYRFPTPEKTFLWRGWVVLDPNRYWLITEGEVERIFDGTKKRASVSFVTLDDGFPFPVEIRSLSQDAQGGVREVIFRDTVWEVPVPGEKEFRLSYYGLPEPPELWPKPTPWWLYIMLSGLALLVLGLAIYTYRRWRQHRLHSGAL